MRTTQLIGAGLVTLALAPIALAASVPNIDVWSGKLKSTKQTISIFKDRKATKASVSWSFTCKDAMGQINTFTVSLTGKPKHHKLKLKGKAVAGQGTASISATLGSKKATGKVKTSYPFAGSTCTANSKFTAKHSLVHGG